jgi:hypothetical protein
LQRVSGEDEIDGNQVVIDNDDEVVDVKMDEGCLVVVVVLRWRKEKMRKGAQNKYAC